MSAITAFGGTVEPGPHGPGVLIAAAVTLDAAATFNVILNGTKPGTEYSQLIGKGPVALGDSLLTLALGVEPPKGAEFEILTSAGIAGIFQGLDEGATFDHSGFLFQITYRGGPSGTSVVVTRVG